MKIIVKNIRKIITSVLAICFIILLGFGLKNKVDPDWKIIKDYYEPNVLLLENSSDSLNQLLQQFVKKDIDDPKFAYNLIADPFIPIMQFSKFKYYFNLVAERKFVVISSVTGSGSSTLIDRIARMITLSDDRIIKIKCAPQFGLKYNKRYIGNYSNSKFKKGELLKFWDKCLKNPNENFIAVIENLDKLNPETFFGPELWEELGNSDVSNFFEDNNITIPDNFYMISTTLSGIGSSVQLNNEHFKRLGRQFFLPPSTSELALYLYEKRQKLKSKIDEIGIGKLSDIEANHFNALSDKKNIQKFLYFFNNTNELITNNYSRGHQLGQWNKLRNLYLPEKFSELKQTFINHVNSTLTTKKITEDSFNSIFYSLENNGKIKDSNTLTSSFIVFKDWGFFTEFTAAISFAIITALFSTYYVRKRKQLVNSYLSESENIYNKYVDSQYHSSDALSELVKLKTEIDKDAKSGKLNYTEAIFFYNSIRDRSEAIEITKNINQSFLQLIDTFLEDNIITESELKKLNTFLEKIKFKIPQDDYERLKDEVTRVWNEHGINSINKN